MNREEEIETKDINNHKITHFHKNLNTFKNVTSSIKNVIISNIDEKPESLLVTVLNCQLCRKIIGFQLQENVIIL